VVVLNRWEDAMTDFLAAFGYGLFCCWLGWLARSIQKAEMKSFPAPKRDAKGRFKR
jgi:hypothetical protein